MFYKTLQATIDKVRKSDIILTMVDFNARVGVEQDNTAEETIGKHAIDKQNQNDRRFIDFCLSYSILVTNTLFPHKLIEQATWIHSKTKQQSVLDYMLANCKFRTTVQDICIHRSTTGSIGTEHYLLRA